MNKILISLIFLLLFSVIRYNVFETANFSKIIPPIGTNYWIAGSILHAKENGLCANYCFNSRFDKQGLKSGAMRRFNVASYEQSDTSIHSAKGDWYVYRSAIRMPTNFYVVLDFFLEKLFNNNSNMPIFISINALCLSIVLTIFLYWVFLEFGLITLIFATISILYSHWLIRFGQFPNFAIFIRFLPFVIGLIFLRHFENKSLVIKNKFIFYYIFGLIFINQLIDYEFTPIVMVGGILPFIYYGIKCKWSFKLLLEKIFFASLASIFAFCLALFIHFSLVYLEFDNFNKAYQFFETKFSHRSFIADPSQFKTSAGMKKCMETDILPVLYTYFNGNAIISSFNPKVIIFCSFICSIFSLILIKVNENIKWATMKLLALSSIVLISLFGVVCNLVIFKSHAACHEHIDYIFFAIPFTLLAAVLVGYTISILVKIPMLKHFKN